LEEKRVRGAFVGGMPGARRSRLPACPPQIAVVKEKDLGVVWPAVMHTYGLGVPRRLQPQAATGHRALPAARRADSYRRFLNIMPTPLIWPVWQEKSMTSPTERETIN
ncbi:MAG: hypothetical protein ACKOW8_00175, partial [Flavobacteriales bacterium]